MNAVRIEETPATFFRVLSGSGLLGKAGVTLSLLLAVVITTATPAMAQGTDLYFSDPLTAATIPPNFTVNLNKYTYGTSGLNRTQSANGNTYGNGDPNSDRPMVKTVSGAYLTTDFVFEVDVTAPASNSDIAYVGFGQGIANTNYFNEPTESFQFRIHNNVGGNVIHAAVDAGQSPPNGFAYLQGIGTLQSGVTTTFRIARSGSNVTLSVPSQLPGASVTVPLTLVPSLNSTNAYLFFGNTAVGTTFSNFSVVASGGGGDTTLPAISTLTASQEVIWPPNHKMVPVTLNAVATDNVGVTSLKIVSATSNEPDNGLGDGDMPNDIQVTGDLTLNLRAERSGKGKGRIYTVTVEARDAAGNAATKSLTVSVPKDNSLSRFPFF